MNTLAGVRLGLWCWVYFCCLLAWVLAAAFIGRTEDNFGLYAPSAVVVLVAGLLGNTLLPLCVFFAYARAKEWQLGSLILEFTGTFVTWALFLGGAAALSSKYSSWGWCFGSTCSLARSVEAWAWITWISMTFLLVLQAVAGCMGPDRDNTTTTGTGPNREVVGATEMGVPTNYAPASAGPQSAYTAGQPEPKGPAAPSAYAPGNTQMPQA